MSFDFYEILVVIEAAKFVSKQEGKNLKNIYKVKMFQRCVSGRPNKSYFYGTPFTLATLRRGEPHCKGYAGLTCQFSCREEERGVVMSDKVSSTPLI